MSSFHFSINVLAVFSHINADDRTDAPNPGFECLAELALVDFVFECSCWARAGSPRLNHQTGWICSASASRSARSYASPSAASSPGRRGMLEPYR